MSTRNTRGERRQALAGAGLVVTRPVGAGAALAGRVRACGGRAVVLPGLSLRMTADAGDARRGLRAALDADIWIFSSPAAVRFAFRLLPGWAMPGDVQAFAVGAGTLRALARHRIRASAPAGRSDSEGLLALPALRLVRGRRIALVGAAGGRDLIASTLRRRGARLDAIHVYERRAPRLQRRHFEALAQTGDPLITLLSSSEALRNLVALLPAALLTRLRRNTLVVSSARLAALAREQGFATIVEAASAGADDLLEAAQRALARHRL